MNERQIKGLLQSMKDSWRNRNRQNRKYVQCKGNLSKEKAGGK